LLASQYSFQWFRRAQEEEELQQAISDVVPQPIVDNPVDIPPVPNQEQFDSNLTDNQLAHINSLLDEARVIPEIQEPEPDVKLDSVTDIELEDRDEIANAHDAHKESMRLWKQDHPTDSLKRHRKLFDSGLIAKLPWEDYVPNEDVMAKDEAKKWADENVESAEANEARAWADEKEEISWMETDELGNQIKKSKDSYQQNAEQNASTLWQRIQDAKK
jgi:hypothetical protein